MHERKDNQEKFFNQEETMKNIKLNSAILLLVLLFVGTGNLFAQTATKAEAIKKGVASAKETKFSLPGMERIQELGPDAPPAPKGYPSLEMVKLAFFAGQIKPIEQPKSIPDEIQEYKNIEYQNVDGKSLTLNMYVPKNLKGPVPCLVFIHGGAWKKGKKEDYLFYNVHFAKLGYVTATVSYRLSGVAKFPAAIQDVNCAIRWIRAHAEEYSINPDQIGAVGGSAGGHLAMLAGFADDPELEGNGGHQDQSSKLQAIVNFYGVCDLTTDDVHGRSEPIDFFGKTIEEAPELYAQGSPLKHLTKDAPPIITFHGTIDKVVTVKQSDLLHEKLEEKGIINYYDRIEGWPHTMDLSQKVNAHCKYMIERFLEKHLPLPQQ